MKKIKNTFLIAVLLTASALTATVTAQVTIGANTPPQSFSVLELISGTNKGLRLPQMTTQQRNDLQTKFGTEATGKALGLQIFNTKTNCVETWNGATWIATCAPPLPPVSPFPPASCGITPASGNNTTYTAKADPNAEAYEFFVGGSSQGEQTGNVLTLGAAVAASSVTVAYLYPPAFLKPTMIDVAGGSFTIGAATTYVAAVSGNGAVTLSNFKMSETPITQAQFSAIMGDVTPSYYFSCSGSYNTQGGINYRPNSALPAENINWYAAIAYCNKLSISEGKTPVYTVSGVDFSTLTYAQIPTGTDANWDAATQNLSANGYRLPTEAEWEYAARGGQKSITNDVSHPLHASSKDYDYSGGNVLVKVGWYGNNTGINAEDSIQHNNGTSGATTAPFYGTKPVKSKTPNALGLYDMSGNVYEWCWNWYASDTYADNEKGSNPVGAATGSYRVFRGGSWDYTASRCRVSYRGNTTSYNRNINVGFRVVVAP